MLKFILIGSILSLSIAGVVFVFNNSLLADNSQNVPLEIAGNNILKNSPFVEKFEPKANQADTAVSESAKNPTPTSDNGNLTQNFIKNIEKNITENNPDGVKTVAGQPNIIVQDPEEITQNLIGEATAKFNAERLNYLVIEKNLKISSDNSKQALLNYAKEFQNIVLRAADEIPASAVAENPTPESVSPMVLIYENAIKKYYALPVPSQALAIHKKQIELLGKKERALKEISNYQSDPVTAILASGELEKIDQEFAGLYIQFAKFVKSI